MFNPIVNTTLHNTKIPNILVIPNINLSTFILFFGGVSPRPSPQNRETIFAPFSVGVCEEFSVNFVNLRWAVAKISSVYSTNNLLGIKNLKKVEKY